MALHRSQMMTQIQTDPVLLFVLVLIEEYNSQYVL